MDRDDDVILTVALSVSHEELFRESFTKTRNTVTAM